MTDEDCYLQWNVVRRPYRNQTCHMNVNLNPITGHLTGPGVTHSARTIGGLKGYFSDEAARAVMDQEQVAYRVEAFEPVEEGREGAVCCATTFLEPGMVGDEYFLT